MLRPDSTRATSFACIDSGVMEFRAGYGTEHTRHTQPLTWPAVVCAKTANVTITHSRQSAVRLIGPNGLLMYLLKKHIINHTNKTPDGAGVVHGTGCCIGWSKSYKAGATFTNSMHILRIMQSAQRKV